MPPKTPQKPKPARRSARRPNWLPPAGRAAAIKRAKEEIARQDAANAEADAADEARQEHYLQRVEAGEVVSSRPPAGVDQVRLYQARIAREQRRLAPPLLNVRGTAEANQRAAIRKILKKAQAGLARAQQEQAAGLADRRGASERRRVRLGVQRGQARGPVVNLTDPQARLMVEGAGGGSVQATTARSCALMTTS